MKPPSDQHAVQQVTERLAELLDLAPAETPTRPFAYAADAVVTLGTHTFVIEWKGSGAAAPVAMAAEQVLSYSLAQGGDAIPLVAVPFMGSVGRERCRKAGVGWLDLSGNARIFAPGIRVLFSTH